MPSPLSRLRESSLQRQRGRCFYCNVLLAPAKSEAFAKRFNLSPDQVRPLQCTAEHLKPRKDGGKDKRGNIVAACRKCNESRHSHGKDLPPDKHKAQISKQIAQKKWHKAYVFERGLLDASVCSMFTLPERLPDEVVNPSVDIDAIVVRLPQTAGAIHHGPLGLHNRWVTRI